MRLFIVLVGVGFAAGCAPQKAAVGEGSVESESAGLMVIPATAEATAGDDVGLEVVWAADDGTQTPVESFTLESSIEPSIAYDEDSVVVTVAGTHDFAVVALDRFGRQQTAAATVDVQPGSAVSLTLYFTDAVIEAGSSTTLALSGADEYGNEVDTAEAAIESADGASIDGSVVSATIVGEYAVTATLGSASAESTFTVVAAQPDSVDLVIAAESAEVGESLAYTAAVVDAYGNATEGTIEMSLPEGVVDDGESLRFDADGRYDCVATVVGTELSDTETVLVDSNGPSLVVENPERGDWFDVSRLTVSGTATDAVSSVASVTVDGEAADLLDGDAFESTVFLDFGVNIIETVAADTDADEDGEPNASSDTRSVLYSSDWFSPDWNREDALLVRINEGPGGLDQLGALAPTIMETVDLESLLAGELYSTSGSIPILFWSVPYSISMTASSLSYGDVSLSIDAVADGYLNMRMTITDLEMAFVVDGSAPFVSLPTDGLVRMDAVHVDLSVRPTIEDGAMSFADMTVDVPEPEGLTLEIGSGLLDLAGAIGLDVESLVVEEMRASIADAVGGSSDGMLDGVLGDFGVEEAFEVGGMTYTLMAELGTLEVDDNGMSLGMETRVVPEEVLSIGALEGPEFLPVFDWWAPDLSAGDVPVQMAMSTDVLNQMMFAMWQGGLLDQFLSPEDLGIDSSLFGVLLPGVEAVNIVTTPHLPPVFTPREVGEGGEQFDLTIGSMEVGIFDGEPSEEGRVMTLYVAMSIPMRLDATGGAIEMALGEATVWTDAAYLDPTLGLSADALGAVFSPILASFVPELTSDLTSIPLPSLDGFTIAIDDSVMAGGDSPPGFWVAQGALE